MKRALTLAAIVSLLLVASALPGGAGHAVFSEDGTIAAPNPSSPFTGGATEKLAACDPASPLNGVDGIWYDITGFGGHTAILTPGEDTTDVDAWFYTADCDFIDDDSMAQEFIPPFSETGGVEAAAVSFDAAFLVVDLFFGAGGTFTLTIS